MGVLKQNEEFTAVLNKAAEGRRVYEFNEGQGDEEQNIKEFIVELDREEAVLRKD